MRLRFGSRGICEFLRDWVWEKLRTWLEIIGNGLGNIGNQSLIRCSVKRKRFSVLLQSTSLGSMRWPYTELMLSSLPSNRWELHPLVMLIDQLLDTAAAAAVQEIESYGVSTRLAILFLTLATDYIEWLDQKAEARTQAARDSKASSQLTASMCLMADPHNTCSWAKSTTFTADGMTKTDEDKYSSIVVITKHSPAPSEATVRRVQRLEGQRLSPKEASQGPRRVCVLSTHVLPMSSMVSYSLLRSVGLSVVCCLSPVLCWNCQGRSKLMIHSIGMLSPDSKFASEPGPGLWRCVARMVVLLGQHLQRYTSTCQGRRHLINKDEKKANNW